MASSVDYLDYITQEREATRKDSQSIAHNLRETNAQRDITAKPSQIAWSSYLQLTALNDGGLDSRADGSRRRAEILNLLDDLHGLLVSDLTEDNVLSIEPRGDNGGNEELGAVARDEEKKKDQYQVKAG